MTALRIVFEVVALLGAALIALSAIGLHRFCGAMTRLHVAAKASSAGVLLLLMGAGGASQNAAIALELLLTGVFLAVTVPLATHGLAAAHLAARPVVADPAAAGDTEPANNLVEEPA